MTTAEETTGAEAKAKARKKRTGVSQADAIVARLLRVCSLRTLALAFASKRLIARASTPGPAVAPR